MVAVICISWRVLLEGKRRHATASRGYDLPVRWLRAPATILTCITDRSLTSSGLSLFAARLRIPARFAIAHHLRERDTFPAKMANWTNQVTSSCRVRYRRVRDWESTPSGSCSDAPWHSAPSRTFRSSNSGARYGFASSPSFLPEIGSDKPHYIANGPPEKPNILRLHAWSVLR